MNEEQKQRAINLIAGWRAVFWRDVFVFWRDAGNDMAALLQELVDAPEPEPFGYFKAEPFGWTDCSETDKGAIALYTAPPAKNQSEQHLEMVKRELFQAQQARLNEAQQRDKLLAALDELLSGTMSMPNRGRATEGKWTTVNALTDTVEKARSVVAEAKGA